MIHLADVELIMTAKPGLWLDYVLQISKSPLGERVDCDNSMLVLESRKCDACLDHGPTRDLDDVLDLFMWAIEMTVISRQYVPALGADLMTIIEARQQIVNFKVLADMETHG